MKYDIRREALGKIYKKNIIKMYGYRYSVHQHPHENFRKDCKGQCIKVVWLPKNEELKSLDNDEYWVNMIHRGKITLKDEEYQLYETENLDELTCRNSYKQVIFDKLFDIIDSIKPDDDRLFYKQYLTFLKLKSNYSTNYILKNIKQFFNEKKDQDIFKRICIFEIMNEKGISYEGEMYPIKNIHYLQLGMYIKGGLIYG